MLEKTLFLDDFFVESPVNGRPVRFRPISVGTLCELKSVAKPIVQALAVIFGGSGATASIRDKDGSVTTLPASPDAVRLRSEQYEKALGSVVEQLLAPSGRETFERLVRDSVPDFPKDVKVADVRGPIARDLLIGIGNANASLFGPFGVRLSEGVAKIRETLEPAASSTSSPGG